MAHKTWLPGCLSLFLIYEKNQNDGYRAYAGCMVALADFRKLGKRRRMYMVCKASLPGCLSLFMISEKEQKDGYRA